MSPTTNLEAAAVSAAETVFLITPPFRDAALQASASLYPSPPAVALGISVPDIQEIKNPKKFCHHILTFSACSISFSSLRLL
jgi:hypothetical protein